jgi:hypothetical protein
MAACAAGVGAGADPARATLPFSVANVYIELNDTDGDLGFHALVDGDAWKRLEIVDPNERMMLGVGAFGRLQKQGMTELFFESAEPSFEELPPEAFFRRFPEGTYEVEAVSLEGAEIESTDRLSHVMPAPPDGIEVSGVPASEDCDATVPSVEEPVVITWEPVTTYHPDLGKPGPVVVERYQLVVERLGATQLSLSVELPPDVTSFEVPLDFTDLGAYFKYEILVREKTGNQTAVESCFRID